MKVLVIVQQSIYNNNKWLSADSNPMMMMGLIDQLLEKTDWTFDVLLAPTEEFADIKSYDELLIRKNSRVKFIPRKGPISAFTNRYHFDVCFFESLLSNNYDVIINNIIELNRNIKTVLFSLNNTTTKTIVGNYWIDCPEINEEKVPKSISYDWRQIDGAECADLVSFTCESTKKAFTNNSYLKIGSTKTHRIIDKSTIWDFGFSAFELDQVIAPPKFDKVTIVFPNRLSGINYTHHEEFIQVVNSIYKKRQDFQVVFTNPSQKVSWEYLEQNVAPLKIYSKDTLNREKYIQLLKSSDIIISLYTIERYGGCANVEGIYCGLYPVVTDYGEYINRIQSSHPLVKIDLSNLEEIIEHSIDTCRKEPLDLCGWRRAKVYLASSYETVSSMVIADIERILQ